MDENIEKKSRAYFSGLKAAVGRKTSAWSEANTLKTEVDRKNSEIHLLKQDVENLKKEAGDLAYSSWKDKTLKAEAFDGLFEEVRKKEDNIETLESEKMVLESQISHMKEPGETPQMIHEEGGLICPSCGFTSRAEARFCRKCGANLIDREIGVATEEAIETVTEAEGEKS